MDNVGFAKLQQPLHAARGGTSCTLSLHCQRRQPCGSRNHPCLRGATATERRPSTTGYRCGEESQKGGDRPTVVQERSHPTSSPSTGKKSRSTPKSTRSELCAHVLAMPGRYGIASQLDLKFSYLTVFAPRCWGRRGARTRPVLNSRSILETGNPGAPNFFPILIAQILRVNLQLYSFSNRRLPHDFPY